MSRKTKPVEVACPMCGAPVGTACTTLGTLTGNPSTFAGVHQVRREIALQTPRPERQGCKCTNHLGMPKVQHRTRAAAVQWSATSRRVKGMRLEFYPCPNSDRWHVRTAKGATS